MLSSLPSYKDLKKNFLINQDNLDDLKLSYRDNADRDDDDRDNNTVSTATLINDSSRPSSRGERTNSTNKNRKKRLKKIEVVVSKHPKTDELRKLLSSAGRSSKTPPAIIIPGTPEYDRKVHPFLPNTYNPEYFGRPLTSDLVATASVTSPIALTRSGRLGSRSGNRIFSPPTSSSSLRNKAIDLLPLDTSPLCAVLPQIPLKDAETGEELSLTTAKWSKFEGIVNPNNPQSLLAMGTGSISIKFPPQAKKSQFINHKGTEGSSTIPTITPVRRFRFDRTATAASLSVDSIADDIETSAAAAVIVTKGILPCASGPLLHPLVLKCLKQGPLNEIFHKHWSSTSLAINVPDNDVDEEALELVIDNDVIDNKNEPVVAVDVSISVGTDSNILNQSAGAAEAVVTTSVDNDILLIPQATLSEANHDFEKLQVMAEDLLHRPDNWMSALEEKYYQELSIFALQLEKNKSLTKEKGVVGGLVAVKDACMKLAKVKVKSLETLLHAVHEEAKREIERKEAESGEYGEKFIELAKKHDEERGLRRSVIRIMQYDSEISLVRRMSELGLLW